MFSSLFVLCILWSVNADGPVGAAIEASPVVVLYTSADDPELRVFDGPRRECRFFDLETFDFQAHYAPARALVITGHSLPPMQYLNHSADYIASVIACFEPDLVVADTCYGFSSPLLVAMSKRRLTPFIVGPVDRLPAEGLLYGPDFFREVCTARRVLAVQRRSGAPLMGWRLNPSCLNEALAAVASWSPDQLHNALQRVHPNLVKVTVRAGVIMLVPVEPARFRRPEVAPPSERGSGCGTGHQTGRSPTDRYEMRGGGSAFDTIWCTAKRHELGTHPFTSPSGD